jgi:hypothetical protein
MEGKPSEIGRLLALSNPAFRGIKAENVSISITRLKRKFGRLDTSELCWDAQHVGKIVKAPDSEERVCDVCGRTFGFLESETSWKQRSVRNPLWAAYEGKPMAMPRREGMISLKAVSQTVFGSGAEGRLVEKSLKFTAELCKGESSLPQQLTAELARTVKEECHVRAGYVKRVDVAEVMSTVMAGILSLADKDQRHAAIYVRMLKSISVLQPLSSKPSKSPKPSLLDEEDAAERVLQVEQH